MTLGYLPIYMKCFQRIPYHIYLNTEQGTQFNDLLIEFQSVFPKDELDTGCLRGAEHKIQTTDEIPINEKFRRTPLCFQIQERES